MTSHIQLIGIGVDWKTQKTVVVYYLDKDENKNAKVEWNGPTFN